MASTDVVFIVGTLFPICMVLYYIAEKCLSNLYEIISVVIGCPVCVDCWSSSWIGLRDDASRSLTDLEQVLSRAFGELLQTHVIYDQ